MQVLRTRLELRGERGPDVRQRCFERGPRFSDLAERLRGVREVRRAGGWVVNGRMV